MSVIRNSILVANGPTVYPSRDSVGVPFEIHRMHSFPAKAVNLGMAKRKLRIVKTTPDFLGICERCQSLFASSRPIMPVGV
jgi:hypothetical protein